MPWLTTLLAVVLALVSCSGDTSEVPQACPEGFDPPGTWDPSTCLKGTSIMCTVSAHRPQCCSCIRASR